MVPSFLGTTCRVRCFALRTAFRGFPMRQSNPFVNDPVADYRIDRSIQSDGQL